ncbi:ABC transporter ATP-binding protein [Nakamurella leprariae]|uniref:ABC transporter ATP-binding protein n=1 Tax=Nakamurella leprariae TaxID=2803911 RepID=A0A939C0Q5_9ACTN|nr:ABC transporter ATP-binding protein [Nakamurella leprariae]MBM9469465.1 ABC transporter ATP-binding protein [Nakamurella leprariae]
MTLVDRADRALLDPTDPVALTDVPLVEVRDLSVTYPSTPDTPAIAGIDLLMAPGRRVALVGESGSGKTTLAMAVAGFLPVGVDVRAATMQFRGIDLLARKVTRIPQRTPGISMLFQDAMTSLDPVFPIGKQLTSLLRTTSKVSRSAARDLAREWLARVGLTDSKRVMNARPYELSGGMRQRVMMALALCTSPQLLIADEPTSALDASLSRGMMDLIVELTESVGTSLLVVSHDINLCLEFCDDVVVMYRGEVVEHRPAATIAADARHPYTRGLLACIPTLESVTTDRLPTLDDFMPATLVGSSV